MLISLIQKYKNSVANQNLEKSDNSVGFGSGGNLLINYKLYLFFKQSSLFEEDKKFAEKKSEKFLKTAVK
jgi:hypothetical protein